MPGPGPGLPDCRRRAAEEADGGTARAEEAEGERRVSLQPRRAAGAGAGAVSAGKGDKMPGQSEGGVDFEAARLHGKREG